MTTKQLTYAAELARTQNFNRAAENLFISQPTLTYQIRLLEDEIGFEIFARSGKGRNTHSRRRAVYRNDQKCADRAEQGDRKRTEFQLKVQGQHKYLYARAFCTLLSAADHHGVC